MSRFDDLGQNPMTKRNPVRGFCVYGDWYAIQCAPAARPMSYRGGNHGKALSFNAHIHIAETAMGVSECLGEPDKIAGCDDVPQWVRDVVAHEQRGGWREFVIIELAPFINDAYEFFELISGGDCPCFYDNFIPAFFDVTRAIGHISALKVRETLAWQSTRQFELNQPIPFD